MKNILVTKNAACPKSAPLVSGRVWIFSSLCAWVLVLLVALPAFTFERTPDMEKEVKARQAVVAENPSSAEANFELAMAYAYSNYIKEGWDVLTKIPKLDPSFAAYALEKYQPLVKKDPKNWKLRYRLAFALYFNQKKTAALRQFDVILALEPKNVLAYGYKALIYGEMGSLEAAISEVKQGISIDNDVAALHLLLADGYFKTGKNWDGVKEAAEAARLKTLGF